MILALKDGEKIDIATAFTDKIDFDIFVEDNLSNIESFIQTDDEEFLFDTFQEYSLPDYFFEVVSLVSELSLSFDTVVWLLSQYLDNLGLLLDELQIDIFRKNYIGMFDNIEEAVETLVPHLFESDLYDNFSYALDIEKIWQAEINHNVDNYIVIEDSYSYFIFNKN